MNVGLYFYKQVSPYQEDVTKDCKLTINEIDSNFLNLKNNEISNAYVNAEEKKAYLVKNDGEELVLDLAAVNANANLNVDYNSVDGIIEITYDGETYSIKDLITKDNLSKEILTKVYTNATLEGIGTAVSPLSIASVQKTGQFKAAIKVLDTTLNEFLPHKGMAKGDRYVTLEEVSDYGLLYNFDAVKRINELLKKTGWRVATKADWDNMLNAIEPCEYRDHASTLNNRVLGHVAGSLLKSTDGWRTAGILDDSEKPSKHDEFDPCEVEETSCKEKYPVHPEKKHYPSEGKDAYGMGLLPGGYAYYSRPMQYNQFGFQGAYWTSDMMYDTDVYTKVFESNESGVLQVGERPSAFLSIRLVKDYDGTNDKGIENILGDNYQTVLMPSLDNTNGYAIWTAQNFRLREAHLESTIPNAGLGVRKNKVYFINEWNGFGWDRLQMEEGDAITILNSQNWNESYRVIEGKLTNVTAYIATNIRHEVKADLDAIRSRIHEAEHQINDNSQDIEKIKQKISEIDVVNAVQDDRIQRTEEDLKHLEWKHGEDVKEIYQKIDDVTSSSKGMVDDLEQKVDDKFEELDKKDEELEQKDAELEQAITDESNRAQEAEKELDEKITSETERAEETEKALDEKIETETERATKAEEELQENIDTETTRAEEAEQKLQDQIDELELKAEDLQEQINTEVERATKAEEELDKRATDLEAHRFTAESNYDNKEGVLTLVAEKESGEYDIKVLLSFDFGTLKSKED